MKNLSILLVDDEASILEILKSELAEKDLFKYIIAASDGQEALAKIDRQVFDILVLDINMPKVDGIRLMESLKAKSKNKAKVLIISGDLNADKVKQARALGVKDFLVKPFQTEEFLSELATIIKREKMLEGC